MTKYVAITDPESVERVAGYRWDTQRAAQGQIVEVSYSDGAHPTSAPAGPGDKYRRTVDHSDGTVVYEVRES